MNDDEIRMYAIRFLLGHQRQTPRSPRDAVRIASILIPNDPATQDADDEAVRLVLQEAIYSVMKARPAGQWGIGDIAEVLRSQAKEHEALSESKDARSFLSNYEAIVAARRALEPFEAFERQWERGE